MTSSVGESVFLANKLIVATLAHAMGLIDDVALQKQRDRVSTAGQLTEIDARLRARSPTDARNFLELLLPMATTDASEIAKRPWLPYVGSAIGIVVSTAQLGNASFLDPLWEALDSDSAWPSQFATVGGLLLAHCAALMRATDGSQSSANFVRATCKFVALCANRYDRPRVLDALNAHVSEKIVAGLVHKNGASGATDPSLSCCDTLRMQLTDYGYWKRVIALPADAGSSSSVVLRVIGWLEANVRDARDEVTIGAITDAVTMLVDLTAQAPTGRFVAWLNTHRSCKGAAHRCDALGWLGWLQRATSVAPLHSRELACLVVRLECNVMAFLARPRSSVATAHAASVPYPAFAALSTPEAHHARWSLLASLLGVDAALPDAQYIADLVAQRLHVPKLGVHFLDVDDYCARHLALYKAHVCWQLWRELVESADNDDEQTFVIDQIGRLRGDDNNDADGACSVAVTCRSTRSSLGGDGRGKPSTFVILSSGSDDRHSVVVVTEYVSHQSERSGMQHLHRLRLHTESPIVSNVDALHVLRLTNPALAGSLAVLQTLRSCGATIRATPWLARFLLGTARATELVAMQAVEDRAGDTSFVLGLGVFANAASLAECIEQTQALPRDGIKLSLSGVDPSHRTSLQVESAAPLEIAFGAAEGAFRPYAAQQEALLCALTRRLTLVIGPPGTGKTDTAVLMIVALLGRFRGARLLVSAVSNLALDQLIDKLVAFAPAIALLRLGGQTQLEVARRFTPDGIAVARSRRFVRAVHELRGALAGKQHDDTILYDMLEMLSTSTPALSSVDDADKSGADAPTVESSSVVIANSFWRSDSWSRFMSASNGGSLTRALPEHAATLGEMRAIGELLAMSHVQRELALLRGCSLVFATTTGMAMRHRRLREGGIAFPLVLMEEAAKVLETEALTCLSHGVERIVLIGDHLQLPPLVAADSLRTASVNYSQSLFARLMRAGVAAVTLNRQGRAAPGIADLYRFRYDNLLDLPVQRSTAPRWPLTDAACFVDVVDGRFKNESNAAEATAVVQFFERLRASGVDASRVSVLSPYRSQCRALERAFSSLATQPRDIATTDAFQGLQNEVVLVSLVSVNSLSAHMRDAARIVVLLSRARVGLVLFGHFATFWADAEWRRSLSAMGAKESGPRAITWQSEQSATSSSSTSPPLTTLSSTTLMTSSGDADESALFPGTVRNALDDEAEKMFAQLANLQL